MKIFDLLRFRNTLLWQVVERKKLLINLVAFGFLFVMIPMVFNIANNFHNITPKGWDGESSIFAILLMAYYITCGAFIVSNLSNKNSRINAFLLPASKLEKFISRYIFLLIAVPLAAFIGLVIGDLVQMSIYKILSGDAQSMTYAFLYNFIHSYLFWDGFSDGSGYSFNVVIFVLYLHSLYLLVGTFFHRRAWIKTTVMLLAALIVVSITAIIIVRSILNAIYGAQNYVLYFVDSTSLDVVKSIIVLALFVFNYWAAYRIYSRMQAINNKWYNF